MYGTLAPGQRNHHQLAVLRGSWRPGYVRGRLFEHGWGAAFGYPGLVLDPEASEVRVHVFESEDLADHWSRLDAFEGPGYRRVTAGVRMPDGEVEACIYVLAVAPDA